MELRHAIATALVAGCALASGIVARAHAWTPEGIPVHITPQHDAQVRVAADDFGHRFVAWVSELHPQLPGDLPATLVGVRRFESDGSPSPGWPEDGGGLPLFRAEIEADGFGGLYLVGLAAVPADAWPGYTVDTRLYHFGANGAPVRGWPAEGVRLSADGVEYGSLALARDPLGVTVGWAEGGSSRQLVQKYSYFGRRLWADDVLLSEQPGVPSFYELELCVAFGSTCATWVRVIEGEGDVYAMRLAPDGRPARGWPAGGVLVCGAAGSQMGAQPIDDGRGGLYVVWSDERGGGPGAADVYGAHLDGAGNRVAGWPADGAPIGRADRRQGSPRIAADGRGGAWVVWQDNRPGARVMDLYFQHVHSTQPAEFGEGGRVLVGEPEFQELGQLAPDARGGFVACWSDMRAGTATGTIYAMRVDATGAPRPGWGPTGWPVSTHESWQIRPALAVDRFGRAFAAWSDKPIDQPDVFGVWANRIPIAPAAASAVVADASEDPVWPDGGMALLAGADALGESLAPPAEDTESEVLASPSASSARADFEVRAAADRTASIAFRLPAAAEVRVDLFDTNGRRVAGEPARFWSAGTHVVSFDRAGLATGVYFARVTHAGGAKSAKVLVVH